MWSTCLYTRCLQLVVALKQIAPPILLYTPTTVNLLISVGKKIGTEVQEEHSLPSKYVWLTQQGHSVLRQIMKLNKLYSK